MRLSRIFATLSLGLLLGALGQGSLQAETDRPTVKLGLTGRSNAVKRDVEFQKYDWRLPAFERENIEASLMPWEPFFQTGMNEEQFAALLRGYDAIHLRTTSEQMNSPLTPELKAHAKMVGDALAKYVEDGGGLFLEVQSVRYPKSQDENYWNIVLQPLGVQIPHEGIFDPTRTFEDVLYYGRQPRPFWFTKNFAQSPILENVHGLCLPKYSQASQPGVPALTYSDDWKVIVRGEDEAKSYVTPDDNVMKTEKVGTYSSAPPIVAQRKLGKGRIVSYPLARIYTGMNYLNPVWPDIVESRGFPEKGWPSDSMRLQLNAYRWVGGPAAELPGFGTHKIPTSAPIKYPATYSLDNKSFPGGPAKKTVKGIIGARSIHGGGNGTVAEYVEAAKAADLEFIVFSDPLEELTEAKLEALKADCAKVSAAGDFLAIPGVQFTDGAGIRWALWGDKVVYPPATFSKKNSDEEFVVWDGKRMLSRGYYSNLCGFAGGGVLSYKELRANKSHPENLWWFWNYFPLVYEDNKLVEDQYDEYLFGLRDLRRVAITSYTGISNPDQVQGAAEQLVTVLPNLETAHEVFNSRAQHNLFAPAGEPYYVTQGPEILEWSALNSQMEQNWRATKGAQRVRVRLSVHSDKGIAEVKVHDADLGLIRRFAGHGAKEITREFELVQDKTHYLTMEVIDEAGKRAFSQCRKVYSYKQSLYRCGDNLNILGPLGMQWHPDRNQFFDAAKNFQNGKDFEIKGIDTSIPVIPMPVVRLDDTISLEGVGSYPSYDNAPGMTSKIMDVSLSSPNVQIATMTLENLAQFYSKDGRAGPSWGSSPQDVSENEYFTRTHKLISLQDRINWYTSWNYRRGREGRKDYEGSFNWHEGEITFKKDVVLKGAVPIQLVWMTCPYDAEKGWGTRFIVGNSPDEVTDTALIPGEKEQFEGTIEAGGFISQLPSLVGYQAFFALPGTEYTYRANLPDGRISIGMGHDGQKVKAGTVFKYRFAVGVFTDTRPDAALLRHTSEAMNLGGGDKGYPLEVSVGKLRDASFFLTLDAAGHETKFTAGPQSLNINLPIVVHGLEDNGCVAVHSTNRPWFRFVSVVENTAYFQESIEEKNTIWVGNLFTTENEALKLTVVIDGQNRGRNPFLEVHNPTYESVTTTIRSPEHTPEFGGLSAEVTIPAGESVRLEVQDGALVTPKDE